MLNYQSIIPCSVLYISLLILFLHKIFHSFIFVLETHAISITWMVYKELQASHLTVKAIKSYPSLIASILYNFYYRFFIIIQCEENPMNLIKLGQYNSKILEQYDSFTQFLLPRFKQTTLSIILICCQKESICDSNLSFFFICLKLSLTPLSATVASVDLINELLLISTPMS